MSPSQEKKGKNRPQPCAKISSGKKKKKTGKKQEFPEHHLGEEAQINGNLKPKVDKKKKKTNNEENNDVSREMQPKNTSRKKRTVVTDRRFESLHYDPKFQSVPKQQSKVAIDERFESMFTDKAFASSSAPVDKRGKSRKEKSPNPLLHYYINQNDPLKPGKSGRLNEFDATLLGDEEEDEDGMSSGSSTSTSSDEEDYDEQSINSDVAHYLMADHESTSRTEEPTHRLAVVNMEWDRIKAVDIYVTMTSSLPKDGHVLSVNVYPSEFGRECMQIEATQGPSSLIYGNDEQINDDDDHDYDDSEDDYDEAKENEKLRLYELKKLRYYYAVVECDSSKTANYLYEELDGTELLKTSNVFDLRFIPDSMEFNHPPRETTTEAPTSYTPPDFQTRALQHSNVKLTWEEDEPDRKRILKRKFNTKQLEEIESDSLMASDGEESDDEETSGLTDGHVGKSIKKERYIALLQPSDHSDVEDDDDGQDMEITFNTGLEDIAKRVQDRKENNSESVWQSYLQKRKEKKIARRRHAKYSSSDESDSYSDSDVAVCVDDPGQPDDFFADESCEVDAKVSKKGNKGASNTKNKAYKVKARYEDENKEQEASQAELELLCASNSNKAETLPIGDDKRYEKGKGKKKIKKQRTEDKLPKEDYRDDPRFKELFNSHHYALDPTDSQFKRSATYARQMLQKQKRQGFIQNKTQKDDEPPDELQPDNDGPTSSKNKDELSSLVRSLKRKTSAFKSNKETIV